MFPSGGYQTLPYSNTNLNNVGAGFTPARNSELQP